MKTNIHIKSRAALALAMLLGTQFPDAAKADLGEVTLSSCPAPVQTVIESHMQNGKLEEIKVLTVQGRKMYVADFDLAGRRDLKLHIAEDGTVVTTREDLALVKAPAAVKAAVEKLIPTTGNRVDDVEKNVSNGKTTYVVEIDVKDGKDIKAVLAEDGTILSQRTDTD